MIAECSVVAVAASLLFVLFVRPKDLTPDEPVLPTDHLQDRKKAIHENLRDLQFDFRTGKLSDADYQASKRSLQAELAAVLLQIRDVTKDRKG